MNHDNRINAWLDRIPLVGKLNRWADAHPWRMGFIVLTILAVMWWKEIGF